MIKKIFLLFVLSGLSTQVNAQFSTIDKVLTNLEERKGINQNLNDISVDGLKFIRITEFEDHTEREFIIFKDNNSTYVKIFDDKETGKSHSNVFTGDMVRNRHGIISIRANLLEGKRIRIPITKTLMLRKVEGIIYLLDINNKDRWIEEKSFLKNNKK